MPPCRRAKVAGVVVGISRPREAVIRHLVPFFARDFASFAADANARIGEETNLDAILHVRVLPLIRALDPFADHTFTRSSVDWVAHASRVLAMASRHRGLFFRCSCSRSLFRRDAETSTRDACATRKNSPIIDCRSFPPGRDHHRLCRRAHPAAVVRDANWAGRPSARIC